MPEQAPGSNDSPILLESPQVGETLVLRKSAYLRPLDSDQLCATPMAGQTVKIVALDEVSVTLKVFLAVDLVFDVCMARNDLDDRFVRERRRKAALTLDRAEAVFRDGENVRGDEGQEVAAFMRHAQAMIRASLGSDY